MLHQETLLSKVGNTGAYTTDDWTADIQLAQKAGIDAFALNIAAKTDYNKTQLANAYTAAENLGFKLFLSFDYAAQGPWDSLAVISMLQDHVNSSAQFKVDNRSFVSTFEGPDNSGDWVAIREAVPIFFLPDWTSVGPDTFRASKLELVDGAFSWDAWPQGATDKTDDSDKAWKGAVGSKSYMMPVSPWFYTNLPEYQKNWLWRGDDIWHNRWQQVLEIQPTFVEILTWNDYGESHYIGPIKDQGVPSGAHKYVDNMPHDHWRDLLPYYIAAYKNGQAPTITEDKSHIWFRLTPAAAGNNGGTSGNAPYQPYVDPNVVVQDQVFFTALLRDSADVFVYIGDSSADTFHQDGAGVLHGSVPFNGRTGKVRLDILRNGESVLSIVSEVEIAASPANGLTNYNAWVGGSG
ncbi:MAG: hypothetical protein LQ351_004861 [Letrouitia transgressa]|nr:MAG: hypothetical protein LQ351_004861 [Letrouitia transgressa]